MTTKSPRWKKRISVTMILLIVVISVAVAALPGLRQGLQLLWVYNANSLSSNDWLSEEPSDSIPFFYDRHVLVPAFVQGETTVLILLDTGAPMTALIGGPHLDGVTLDIGRTVSIGGSGQGNSPTAQVLSDLDLTVGAVALTDLTALLIPWEQMGDFFTAPSQVYIHGILGYDLFRRYVVEIDFQRELLTLHRPDDFDYTGEGEIMPLTFVQRKPYFDAEVTQLDGTTVPVKLNLDLGDPAALSLIPSAESGISAPPGAVSGESRGLSGVVDERVSRIRELRFGQHALRDVVASFSMEGFATTGERNGVVGLEALSRFRVFIDYPHDRLILEPTDTVGQPFEADMSGITWVPQGDSYVIRLIRAGSPAEMAGLQVDDELVSIDDIDPAQLRLGELVERMRAGDGAQVVLELQRGTEIVSVPLTLRRRI